MKRLALIAAGGATLVAALLATSPGAAPVATETGLIVFQSDRTGNSEIWVMGLDGSGQRQLTKNGVADATPAWTPDGDIVFASTRDGTWDIWRMDGNGQNAVRLTTGTAADASNEFDPAVSPDGIVAYEGDGRGNWDVYRLPGGDPSSEPIRMTNSQNDDFDPSFSLDGGDMTFSTGTRTSFVVSSVPTDSPGRVQTIKTDIPLSFDPRWSPTGNDIAFTRAAVGGGRDIVRMEADGQNVKTLTSGATDDWGPAWTGEGHIVFTRSAEDSVGGSYQLYVMDENGGGEQRLTQPSRGINVEPDVRLVQASPQRGLSVAAGGWALSAGCKVGTAGNDHLVDTGGKNCVKGLAGNDTLEGMGGNDVIYGGAGNDAISVHYGRGYVDCGPGRDIYHVAKTRKRGYKFRNCEKVDYRSEAQRGGHGLKPLH